MFVGPSATPVALRTHQPVSARRMAFFGRPAARHPLNNQEMYQVKKRTNMGLTDFRAWRIGKITPHTGNFLPVWSI